MMTCEDLVCSLMEEEQKEEQIVTVLPMSFIKTVEYDD